MILSSLHLSFTSLSRALCLPPSLEPCVYLSRSGRVSLSLPHDLSPTGPPLAVMMVGDTREVTVADPPPSPTAVGWVMLARKGW